MPEQSQRGLKAPKKFSKKQIFQQIFQAFQFLYYWFIRAAYKWFLHIFTGRSEIERILSQKTRASAQRIFGIEYSLTHSKRTDLQQLCQCPVEALPCCIDLIARAKYIGRNRLESIRAPLANCLSGIMGYNQLIREVEWMRKVQFDWKNETHEELLHRLWNFLKPDTVLTDNISRQWMEIGFQGENPATDFRGMGLLGLEQLVFFCECAPENARSVFSQSLHPKIGLPFSITGISMTALTRTLLIEESLKPHFYNTVRGAPDVSDFHKAYCSIFCSFVDAWKNADPESIMEYNSVREKFYQSLTEHLAKEWTCVLPEISS